MCVYMHPQAHRPVTRGLTQYSPLYAPYSLLILVGGCSAFPYFKVGLTIGCRRQGTAGGAGRGWQGVSRWFKEVSLPAMVPSIRIFQLLLFSFLWKEDAIPKICLNQLSVIFDSSALEAWRIWENNIYQGMAALSKVTPFPWSVLLCQTWQFLLCLWQVPAGTSPNGTNAKV